MIRIIIVSAYPSVRAGLHALLAGMDDLAIVAEASGSTQLAQLLPETPADVVIYDDHEVDNTRVLEVLSRSKSELGLVVLSDGQSDYQQLRDCPLRGWAYLLQETADGAEIAGATRAVIAGLVVFDRSTMKFDAPIAHVNLSIDSEQTLTPREREVLQLMAQGLANKVIAKHLEISLHTVKFHITSILTKLGASSRTEAVALGAKRGYVIF